MERDPGELELRRELRAARKEIEDMQTISRVLGESLSNLAEALEALDMPEDQDVEPRSQA